MEIALAWYGLALATTLLNAAIFAFIAHREKDSALREWSLAWATWALAVVPLARLDVDNASPWLTIPCGSLWVISSLFFLRGTYRLAARHMPWSWYGVATTCIVVALGLGLSPRGGVGMMPLVLFQAIGMGTSGWILLRGARGSGGAWVAGGAMSLLSLHLLDAPLLAQHPEWFSWGFVFAATLEMAAALGMVALHYEHARAELLETQRILERARRIEALGRVAGGVAHDFNNMLTVMQAHVETLRQRDSGNGTDSVDALEDAIRQAARLTEQLLTAGGRLPSSPRDVDVREVVEAALALVKQVVPERIRLRTDLGDTPCLATLDRSLLEQVVLNLVTNARDAIDGPGTISVQLEPRTPGAGAATLRVADDGTGMDDSVLSRAFEPFFTTKGVGRGTGLGLATVHGAVTQLGGSVRVDSRVGRGTTFEVVLPLRTEAASCGSVA